VRPARTAEPIEMPFGMWTRVLTATRIKEKTPEFS